MGLTPAQVRKIAVGATGITLTPEQASEIEEAKRQRRVFDAALGRLHLGPSPPPPPPQPDAAPPSPVRKVAEAKVEEQFRAIMRERPNDPPTEEWMLAEMTHRLGASPGRQR